MLIRLESQQALPYRTEPSVPGSLWIALLVIVLSASVVLGTSLAGLEVLAIIPGLAGFLLLLKYPEIALGLLLTIGSFKGARELQRVPVDLTLVLLIILALATAYRIWKRPTLGLPWEFCFFVPIIFMMVLSLTYTPHLAAGIDKTVRFLLIDGICILAPFVILTSPAKMMRLFLTMAAAGLAVSAMALSGLGGYERLTTPSGDTIQMGHDAALGIVIVWFGLLPHRSLPVRVILYAAIGLMGIGMVGSGSRGPFIGFSLAIFISIIFQRRVGFGSGRLLFDLILFAPLCVVAVVSAGIPKASFNYLAQLENVNNTDAFLGGRAELIKMGLNLILEHPVAGVGINGFPTRITGQGNWPHNIPVEIGSELGVAAMLSFCCLAFFALKATYQEFIVADDHWRSAVNLAMCFMIIEFVSMLNTGNINDARELWTCLSIPFVIRQLRITGQSY